MTQPLGVIDLYFSTAILEQPTDPISRWLYQKLNGTSDSGLNARKIKDDFYPTCYEDWRTRRVLNLFNDSIADNINARGSLNIVRRILQQAGLFNMHCLQQKALSFRKTKSKHYYLHLIWKHATSTTDIKCSMAFSRPLNGCTHHRRTRTIP